MGRKSEQVAALRLALKAARELGEVEMDWLGTGSDQSVADREKNSYMKIIEQGEHALWFLHGADRDH